MSRFCKSSGHLRNQCTCSCTQIHANTHFLKRHKAKNKLAKIWHSLSIVTGIGGPRFVRMVDWIFLMTMISTLLLVFMSPKSNKKSSLYPRDCSIFVFKLWYKSQWGFVVSNFCKMWVEVPSNGWRRTRGREPRPPLTQPNWMKQGTILECLWRHVCAHQAGPLDTSRCGTIRSPLQDVTVGSVPVFNYQDSRKDS